MKKNIIVAIACLMAMLSNAQELPKGKVIKDLRVGKNGSSPSSFLSFDNSIFSFNYYDSKYYRINESLNNAVLVPALDSVGGILYSDNDRIIYSKQTGLEGAKKTQTWLYRATTNKHTKIPGFDFGNITSNGNVSNGKLYFFAEFYGSSLFVGGVNKVLAYITLDESDNDLQVHLVDFQGGLSTPSLRWLEKNNNLYCYCNGVKDDIIPSVNSFTNQLCEVSLTNHVVEVYDGYKILYNNQQPGNPTGITGMLGNYIFFGFMPGMINDKGYEPYSFNTITKEYRLIQDLSLGKNSQNNDANSEIGSVIYDNDYLYFTAGSDAAPRVIGNRLYSFNKSGSIVPEELTNFTPVLPLGDGYVLLMANTTVHIRNINTGITNAVIDQETNNPLIISDSYKDIFTRNNSINKGEGDLANTYWFEREGNYVVSFDGNFHLIDPQSYEITRISNNSYADTSSMATSEWFFTQSLNDSIVRFFYNGRNSKVGNEPAYMDIDFNALSLITSVEDNKTTKDLKITSVEVYNLQGQKITSGAIEIVNELREGMYIVQYHYDNGSMKSEKISKVSSY